MEINKNSLKPRVVLGVAAHPDDLDFGAAGSMAKYAKNGAEVYYLILTDGSKGTDDHSISERQLQEIRNKEQKAAIEAIGGAGVYFLEFVDGELENNKDVRKEIVKHIRKLKPDLIITMDPSMIYSVGSGFINHPDHRAAGQATLDALYPLARDHKAFPELLEDGLDTHKTLEVLLINLNESNYYEGITDTIDNKIAALKAHESQIKDIEGVSVWIKESAKQKGSESDQKLAEGFIRISLSD